MNDDNVIYRDDYLLITPHLEELVAVQVGQPPEDAHPTIVNATAMADALDEYLEETDDE